MRIGIDLGGTKIEVIALDEHGGALVRHRVSTPAGDYRATIQAIADLVARVEAELGSRGSVGIGTPGSTSPVTGLIRNANSTVLIGKPLAEDLARKLCREIRMTNDANCFVLSEALDGAARDGDVVFGVILGTGVGGGISVSKRIVDGVNAIAGEWGHNPLPWAQGDEIPGPLCYCGKHGCIETFLCGPALTRQYRARTERDLAPTEIALRADAQEPEALGCMNVYEDRLARGLASVINILDPDTIVLGGGLSNIQRLYVTLRESLPRYVFSDTVRTKIVRAVHGDSSGVRGAALLW